MAFDNLLIERDAAVAVITINRPKVLNALNNSTLDELRRAALELKRDEAVRAIVITGAGDKSFVAGADINEFLEQSPASGRDHALAGQHVFDLIENLGKPVIAAVNGYALGGGCELAMACTLRIAADTARFGQPEINLGLVPGYGGTQRLPRLVGKGKAMELILTGLPISAGEADRSEPHRGAAGGAGADRHRVHHSRDQSWRGNAIRAGVRVRSHTFRPGICDRRHA
jgi:enoyl-CoA hydratase